MDLYLFQQINSFAGRAVWLDALGVFSAKYLIYLLVVAAVFIFWKKRRLILQSLLAVFLAKFVLVDLIKFFWPKPRPFFENTVNLLLEQTGASFPSGHAAFSFALSAVVFFYNKKVGALFFAAAFLISISRVFVGVHWPSDILAGALVGIFSGWLIVKIFRKF